MDETRARSSLCGNLSRFLVQDDARTPATTNYQWAVVLSLGVVIALNIVARGQTLLDPLYSPDSYALLSEKPDGELLNILSDGRFVSFALYKLLSALGLPLVRTASAQMFAATLAFLFAGLLFAKAIFEDIRPLEVLAFCALFTLNPLATEFFYFSETTLRTCLTLLLAAAAVFAAYRAGSAARSRVFAAVATFLALGVYQLALAHLATATAFKLFSVLKDRGTRGRGASRDRFVDFAIGAASLAAGAVAYAAAVFAVKAAVPEIGSSLLFAGGAVDLVHRFEFAGKVIGFALLPAASVSPLFISALATSGAFILTGLVLKPFLDRRDALGAGAGAIVIVAALASSEIIFLLVGDVWPVARVMSPIALFLAYLALFGYRASGPMLRVGEAVVVAVVLAGYIGASSSLLFEQRRINRWDLAEANRIIARLETRPEFAAGMTLAVSGSQWRHSYAEGAAYGTMNASAFRSSWAQVGLFEEATGYRFAKPSPEATSLAAHYCEQAKPWPAADSTTILEGIAIVCLPAQSGP